MGNWIQKYDSYDEYEDAEHSYPNVSLVGLELIYTPASSVNDKVMVYFNGGVDGGDATLFNEEASDQNITAMWLNDEPIFVEPSYQTIEADEDVIVKYAINTNEITDAFSGDLGIEGASSPSAIEFLIPAKVTEVNSLPNNHIDYLIFLGDTPPSVTVDMSSLDVTEYAYCPDDAVSTYQNSVWGGGRLTFVGLSEYDGRLREWVNPIE